MSIDLNDILNDAGKAAPYLESILAVLAVVRSATGIGGAPAERLLQVITAAVHALDDHVSGKDTETATAARIKALTDELAAHNAAADAALAAAETELRARFPEVKP